MIHFRERASPGWDMRPCWSRPPEGTNILIDPFIAQNPKYPKEFVLPAKIHYILLTHGHGDHISDAVPVAAKHDSTVVAIYELADYMARQGRGPNHRHEPGRNRATGRCGRHHGRRQALVGGAGRKGRSLCGVAAGFVLTIADGPVLYHAGDTRSSGDMKLIRELYRPEVAMLPIGGHYTMGPKEAALAVRFLQPKIVLPLHFGTFPPLKGTPEQLAALVDGGVKVVRGRRERRYTFGRGIAGKAAEPVRAFVL